MIFVAMHFLMFAFGLAIGSFSNVCISRWHDGTSVVSPGSHCDSCGHVLTWKENIPILSYFIIRGKCSNCNVPLSLQYPFVEFLTGITFLAIFSFYGLTPECAKMMFITWLFIVATVSDINYREIPNELTLISIPVMVGLVLCGMNTWTDLLLGIAPAVSIILLMIIISFGFPNTFNALGGGDIKFIFAVGGTMGLEFVMTLIVVACLCLVLVYGAFIVEDIFVGKKTYVPMMVGFSMAYVYMLLTHYMVDPYFDIIYVLGFMYLS